ncbi:MAG TPA: hypothetical protein VKC51_08910 [Lacunisphaera sp.]|nr:hypothetical protein [Lacunisphaera sp.]
MPSAHFSFQTRPVTSGHSIAKKFNVVILYEHLAYVRKAMATYLHLVRELAGDFVPDFRLWRIDAALAPELAAEAGRNIAAAEVIIMAVNGRETCPLAFQRWKDRAGQSGGLPPHAVIALMEASDESVPAAESWSGVLCGAATQIHPEVFVCDSGSWETAAEQAQFA